MKRSFFLLAAVTFLAACSPHARQEIPLPVTTPESFIEAGKGKVAHQGAGRWWKAFGDSRLDGFMEEVFTGNLDLRQAVARLEQARAALASVGSARFPSLTIEGAGGRARQGSSFGSVTSDTYRLSAAAAFELDLWGKIGSRTEAARYDLLAVQEDARTLCLTLSAQAADLYYLAIEQRAQLELTDRTIVSFRDAKNLVESRYRQGLVPAVDVYQARQNLAAAEARRPLFESTLATTEHGLALLAGRYPGRGDAGELTVLPGAVVAFSAGIPSRLLADRPDVRGALSKVRGSDERIAAAIADRFPSFGLVGAYGGASDDLSTLLDSGNIVWNLLLNLAQPVFDGGRRSAEVERSRAVFRENLARYHQVVLNAFREVEDALVQGRTTEERIAALDARVAASSAALRLATDRYMQGLTDFLPVLTSQALSFDAESQLLSARRQLISDRISLARALGGEWMNEEVNKLSPSGRKKE